MFSNVIALSGAIVESCDNGRLRFYHRCNHCMNVENRVVTMSAPARNNITTSDYRCPKCNKSTKVQLKGI